MEFRLAWKIAGVRAFLLAGWTLTLIGRMQSEHIPCHGTGSRAGNWQGR
jgi:hypothetical protein